jgi:uncharacterized protein (TIGR00369 family)
MPNELASDASALTHRSIDRRLSGVPLELSEGKASVRLETTPEMSADELGLVHGGFLFSCADYAAMLAVNRPTVVLGAADVRFLKPVVVGETLVAWARVEEVSGRKCQVVVQIVRGSETVFTGTFTAFVPERHVLDSEVPA